MSLFDRTGNMKMYLNQAGLFFATLFCAGSAAYSFSVGDMAGNIGGAVMVACAAINLLGLHHATNARLTPEN